MCFVLHGDSACIMCPIIFLCMTQLYLIELSNFEMKMREIDRDRDEGQIGEEEKKKASKRKRETEGMERG